MPSAEVFASSGAPEPVQYTTNNGAPYSQPYDAQRIASYANKQVGSSLLLQDSHLIELLAHFDRGEYFFDGLRCAVSLGCVAEKFNEKTRC